MADALAERAIRDEAGARWRFVEHRQDPPLLPPGTSWMQGAAGIAAFLLRLARVVENGPDTPVIDRPDQWWADPRPAPYPPRPVGCPAAAAVIRSGAGQPRRSRIEPPGGDGCAQTGGSAWFADDQRDVALGAALVAGVAGIGRHHLGPQLRLLGR